MGAIKLLIIEDERAIRDMLRFSFANDDFQLFEADDTVSAKSLLANTLPDLILLDWMLPSASGIDFIRWIKKEPLLANIPIIMLTAKAEEDNKIKGLMTGADDYVTKPFSPKELKARIKTILRRGVLKSPDNTCHFENLSLNLHEQSFKINDHLIELTPTEYKLMAFFMKNPKRSYTRDQLISAVWGGNVYIDERTVDVHIRRLRDKLKTHSPKAEIKTMRGTGYQLACL